MTRPTEDFAAEGDLETGDVVSHVSHQRVTRARTANAALVIGVVIDRAHEAEHREHVRVALNGRARCKVIGPIDPGDLLVPSDQPGCARKGVGYIKPGTLIGKALSSHHPRDDGEQGMIDLLVMLG